MNLTRQPSDANGFLDFRTFSVQDEGPRGIQVGFETPMVAGKGIAIESKRVFFCCFFEHGCLDRFWRVSVWLLGMILHLFWMSFLLIVQAP